MEFEDDTTMSETILERLDCALTVEDILLLRAASVWHYALLMLKVAAEWGDDGDAMSSEQQRALEIVGMLPEEDDGTISLDSHAVRGQLNRAEVAVGYLFARYGVPVEDRPASYPSTDFEPALGPMDVIEAWDKIAKGDPGFKLSERESRWMNTTLDSDKK
jgi:hypothetical protein